jgi:hypothetical protein
LDGKLTNLTQSYPFYPCSYRVIYQNCPSRSQTRVVIQNGIKNTKLTLIVQLKDAKAHDTPFPITNTPREIRLGFKN